MTQSGVSSDFNTHNSYLSFTQRSGILKSRLILFTICGSYEFLGIGDFTLNWQYKALTNMFALEPFDPDRVSVSIYSKCIFCEHVATKSLYFDLIF